MEDLCLNYVNYDVTSVVTSIKVNELAFLLKESNYEKNKSDFLIDGFTNGFSMGYKGPRDRVHTSSNIPLSVGNKTILWNKIMKEVKLGRYAGPFKKPPFKYFIQSPIGLVSKDNGKDTRLIFHLSFDFGEEEH